MRNKLEEIRRLRRSIIVLNVVLVVSTATLVFWEAVWV